MFMILKLLTVHFMVYSVKSYTETKNIGQQTTFYCNGGPTSVRYKWQKKERTTNVYYDLVNMSRYYGINSSKLTITDIILTDEGLYQCVHFDANGLVNGRSVIYELQVGNWGWWSVWTICGVTCGSGTQRRVCDSPYPANGGSKCVWNNSEERTCSASVPCPVNGNWEAWLSWTSCRVTCGSGTQFRNRNCNNPAPAYGGLYCSGTDSETQNCNTYIACPVHGNWGAWTSWTSCGVTCGSGPQTRNRYCNSPAPAYGGLHCFGTNGETQNCNTYVPCPVDGDWTFWSEWSTCSTYCGGGNKTRERNCTNPSPMYGGKICNGSAVESAVCSVTNYLDKSTSERNSSGVIIGGLVAAVVILILISVVLFITVCRLRRKSHRERNTNKGSSEHITSDLNTGNECLKINKLSDVSSSENVYDEIYATKDGTGDFKNGCHKMDLEDLSDTNDRNLKNNTNNSRSNEDQ